MIKELEDYNWFPKTLRRFQMEYIGSIIKWFHFYRPLVQEVQVLLKEHNVDTIQDLCAGSGIPAVYIQSKLGEGYTTVLTDKFPDASFVNTATSSYLPQAVDVLQLKPEQGICYTMYNAFHHFTALQQQEIVQKMKAADAPFIFAEILEPDIFTLLKIVFTTTVVQLLTAPFVHPFSLLRLLFTYIIPVNIFTVTYDGVVSVLKSKSVKQYQNLLQGFTNSSYEISVYKYQSWKGAVICIKGNPQNK